MRKFWVLAATVALGLPGFGSNGVTPKEESSVPKWPVSAPKSTPRNAADQNLVASGKIDSLSLIALGLGPKHQTTSLESPVASQPGNP